MKGFLKNAITATLTAATGAAGGIGYSTYEFGRDRDACEAAVQKVSDDLMEERGRVAQLVSDFATEKEARTGLTQELAQSQEVAAGLQSMLDELQSELNLRDGEVAELRTALQSLDREVNPQRLIDAIRNVRSSLVRVGPGDRTSSGFFINDCDYIVTSAHVTAGERRLGTDKDGAVLITLNKHNRTEEPLSFYAEPVKLNGADGLRNAESSFIGGSDISILRVPPDVKKKLPAWVSSVEFRDVANDPLRDGEGIFIAGHPHMLDDSISVGHISNNERHFDLRAYRPNAPNPCYPVVQINDALNPGDSGGVTADFNGRVIGISFFTFGNGIGHSRHVLDLEAYLAECGIGPPLSEGKRAIVERWHKEWNVLQERERLAHEAAQAKAAPKGGETEAELVEPLEEHSGDEENPPKPSQSILKRIFQLLRSASERQAG